jgi:hypothetical protein
MASDCLRTHDQRGASLIQATARNSFVFQLGPRCKRDLTSEELASLIRLREIFPQRYVYGADVSRICIPNNNT